MGYAQVPLALRVQGLSAAQKEVLIFLTDAANMGVQRRGAAVGRFACFHSQGRAAQVLDRDRKTVGRAFAALERRGLIGRVVVYTARAEVGRGRDADTVTVHLEAMAAHSTMTPEQLANFREKQIPRGYRWGRNVHECGSECPGPRTDGGAAGGEDASPSPDNPTGGAQDDQGVGTFWGNPWDILGGGWGQKAPAEQGSEQVTDSGTPFVEPRSAPLHHASADQAPEQSRTSHIDAELGPAWPASPEKAHLLDTIQQVARGELGDDDLIALLGTYIGEGIAETLHADGGLGYHQSPPAKASNRYEAGVWLSKFYNVARWHESPDYHYPQEITDAPKGTGWRAGR